ncbi:MAG: DUF2066 domain-containing protein [Alphaproteobacteria bacterium]
MISGLNRIALAGLLAVMLCLCALPGFAAPIDDVLTVNDIDVDVTAGSAAEAKQKALEQAQQQGFVTIVRRTVLAIDQKRVPTPEGDKLERLVRDFEFVSEKTSDVRYIAKLNIRYRPNPFFDHLGRLGVRYAETVSKPLVVVPLMVTDQGGRLWDAPNPWLTSWQNLNLPPTLAPVVVPYGELGDVQSVSITQAAQGDALALGKLADRYSAKGALVTLYRPTGPDKATVILRQVGGKGLDRAKSLEVRLQGDETPDKLYIRAISATLVALEEAWREGNSIDPTVADETMRLAVPVARVSDWPDIRKRLGNTGPVRGVELKSFSTTRYEIAVSYSGTMDTLMTGLRQQGLMLAPIGVEPDSVISHELIRVR